MDLISRAQWGAPTTSPAAGLSTARGVAVHWAGASYTPRAHSECAGAVRSIRATHLANTAENYVDVAYNLLVCQHGYVYEGRGARKRSGANGSATANQTHYAVCALWAKDSGPAPAALKTGLRDAIDYLRARGAGTAITGHRDHVATECPGAELYAWARSGAPRPTTTTPPETGGTDVPKHIYYERKGPVTLTPGDWYTVTWDRVWRPGGGWADRDLAQTLLSGEHFFSLDFAVRAEGLAKGQELQMRVARNHRRPGEEWARAKSWPIGSPVHDGGRLHAVHHWQGHLPGSDDNRLVCDVLVGGDRPVVIDQLTASLLYWPA